MNILSKVALTIGGFLLVGCDTTPPTTPADLIARSLIGQTHYYKRDSQTYSNGFTYYGGNYHGFHRRDGVFTSYYNDYGTAPDRKERGKWYVKTGQVCYQIQGRKNDRCVNVYQGDNGRVRFTEGFLVKGDRGGTQRLNGVASIEKPVSLKEALDGLNKAIAKNPGAQAVGTVLGGLATAGGGQPAPASSKAKTFSCTLNCTSSSAASATGIGDYSEIKVSVSANSVSDAKSYASSNHSKICRRAGLKHYPDLFISCR